MTRTRPGALLLTLGLALLGVAACGDDPATGSAPQTSATASPTPTTNGTDALPVKQALAAASKAYLEAETVHVKGTIVDEGSEIGLDLRQTKKGDSSGTITMDGAKVKVLTVGRTAYISGDKAFWTEAGGAEAYGLMKGKWVKTKLDAADFAQFAIFTDRRQFADNVLPKDLLAGEREDVGDVAAWRFEDSLGAGFYVALEGEPYPVKFSGKEGTSEIDLSFVDYGEPVDLTPPPASKIVEG